MAQWEKLTKMPAAFAQQLHDLYDKEALPMDVRHYLSTWIESQPWQRAAGDYDLAMVLFQGLLENLDIQCSRFLQEESFLMQHNIRRYKQNFQRYQDNPCILARNICWFLEKEKEILQTADLAEQVQFLQVEQGGFVTSAQQDLDRRMASLKNEVQCMEHTVACLEEQQDEFDFKYQTFCMEAVTSEAEKHKFQVLINKVNECRQEKGMFPIINNPYVRPDHSYVPFLCLPKMWRQVKGGG